MTDDAQLLRRYGRDGSEAAFRELVARHVDLVYSTARRKLGGEAAQAEDVTQAVFADLARKAAGLSADGVLAGWLYQHTCFVAASTRRREQRRQNREQAAATMNSIPESDDAFWQEIAPVLDDMMARLDPHDRDALVLRFFERQDLRTVGTALGLSPDAAQKRVTRALERLRSLFAKRGITSSATALSLTLTTQAVTAAPAGLAAVVAGPALAAGGVATTLFQSITIMSKLKAACLGACLIAGVATPLVWQHRSIARQRERITDLENRLASGGGGPSQTELARHAPPSLRRPSPAAGALAGTPAADHAAADGLARVLAEPDQIKRLGALSALLQAMRPEEAPGFGRLFRDRLAGGSEFSNEYQLFLRAWGGIDGAAAVAFAIETDRANTEDTRSAFAGWAAREPLAASAWLDAHPQGGQTEYLAAGVAEGWMQRDLDAAARFIEARPRSDARTGMLGQLFQRLLETRGVGGAKDWFAGITANENNTAYRERAFDHIAKHLARTDPEAALSWLVDHAGQPYSQSEGVAAVIAARAAADPASAAEWALAHPEIVGHHGPHTALAAAIESWVKQDPNAAAAWLGQKMNTPAYDPAAQTFVNRIAALDPESAFAWAQTIRDESLRHESQATAARPWLRAAPDTAKAALADAGWAAADIDRLQKPRVAAFHDVLLTQGEGLADRSVSFTLATGEADMSAAVGLSLDAEIAEFHVARATEELAAESERAARVSIDATALPTQALRVSVARPQNQSP